MLSANIKVRLRGPRRKRTTPAIETANSWKHFGWLPTQLRGFHSSVQLHQRYRPAAFRRPSLIHERVGAKARLLLQVRRLHPVIETRNGVDLLVSLRNLRRGQIRSINLQHVSLDLTWLPKTTHSNSSWDLPKTRSNNCVVS